ncbi:MAG: acyl-CoA/acyl-ACP dehydrogenase [Deltaproteobacteria bacterium]|nr:acyl-CoA/acyl-ACP dehydrogenase [Deltaproteobacteria bacterium]
MAMTATERQQHFLELAAAHAEDFKPRVAQHDRENSFPFENVAAMKTSGYTNMTVPAELGGGGANLLDLVLAQERLARGDGPTAVAINMHIFNVWVRADLWHLGDEKQRPFLAASARDRLILSSGTSDPRMNTVIGFAGLNDTTRRAEKVAGGYQVNGRAGFGTLCACADFLEETAHYDDPQKGPLCLFFSLPAKTPGIKIQNNWDSLSIRASASHDIVWENVFVPEESVTARPARTWDTYNNVFVSWFMTSVSACYLGIAQAARDYAFNWVRDRIQLPFDRPVSHYPGNQFLAAEMEVGLRAARATLVQTASALSEPALRANPSLMDILACKHFVTETAVSVVDKAMRIAGGAALSRSGPLEQMYRDIRAAIIHPLAGYDTLGLLGKLAFGIPPDTMPRWV